MPETATDELLDRIDFAIFRHPHWGQRRALLVGKNVAREIAKWASGREFFSVQKRTEEDFFECMSPFCTRLPRLYYRSMVVLCVSELGPDEFLVS